MSVITYNYFSDKNKKLSDHFAVGEFASPSDYNGNYPAQVLIDSDLIDVLEMVYSHFGADKCIINSGYRSSSCDKAVGGSGYGPHTQGMAADAYYYKNGSPIPSRLISCYLQDIDNSGIGYCCGGNPNGTHIDVLARYWHGDERDYSVTVSDYYSYTGTTKSEFYGSGGSSTPTSESSAIKEVQQWLGVTADGIYGNQTKAALVKKLQTVLNLLYGANLAVDGIFGNKTASALPNICKGSAGDLIKVLQGFLICHGYDTNGFDGIFGNATESAVRDFQSDNGLYVDGIAGKATFEELCG